MGAWGRVMATSRTDPGLIPGGVTKGFSPWLPPKESCVLWLTQLLKMSTRDFSWGKGGRWFRLTTYHPRSARQENPGP